MIHRNQEGYKDPTAGKAIENILKEDKNMLDTMKGDILDVYTTDGTIGNPVMVVTADNNQTGGNVSVVYLKEIGFSDNPLHVPVLARTVMFAHCDRVFTIRKDRIAGVIRTATEEELHEVNEALCRSFGITVLEQHEEPCAEKKEDLLEMARIKAQADVYKSMYDSLLERMLEVK